MFGTHPHCARHVATLLVFVEMSINTGRTQWDTLHDRSCYEMVHAVNTVPCYAMHTLHVMCVSRGTGNMLIAASISPVQH